MLRVDFRIVRINEVLLVNDDVMEVHPSVDLGDVVVGCPTVRHDVGTRETPLLDDGQQRRGSSGAHHLQPTSPALSLDGTEHPDAVHDSPSVVFSMEEVALIDLDNNRLPVDVEPTELDRVSPGIFRADIPDEVAPVDERLLGYIEMPSDMVHGGVRRPR